MKFNVHVKKLDLLFQVLVFLNKYVFLCQAFLAYFDRIGQK